MYVYNLPWTVRADLVALLNQVGSNSIRKGLLPKKLRFNFEYVTYDQ